MAPIKPTSCRAYLVGFNAANRQCRIARHAADESTLTTEIGYVDHKQFIFPDRQNGWGGFNTEERKPICVDRLMEEAG